MFDGVPAEQLHQFIAASSRTSIPFPISFSNSSSSHHHQANTNTFPAVFDTFSTTYSQQVLQPHHFLHSLQQPQLKINEEKEKNSSSWSQDELLALLRIRSSLENWFPELTWNHVSRRLEELGYKRSAEKCKEKFEEESRNFNDINYNKSYRTLFGEFDDHEEELYHGQHPQDQVAEQNKKNREQDQEEEDKKTEQNLEEDPRNDHQMVAKKSSSDHHHHQDKEKLPKGNKKRKLREKKFEMFKGFCEDIVKKMIAQQEEMHNKLLEDMVKRDEAKVAREEAWKKQEIDRINKELEIRACEQAIACDRQATIIKFLKKLSSSSSEESGVIKHKVPNISTINLPTSSSLILAQNPNPTQNLAFQNPSSNLAPTIIPKIPIAPQNPSSSITQNKPLAPTSTPIQSTSQNLITSNSKDDIGKRWPRDEVLALINLRCNIHNNGDQDHKEGASSRNIPLWERISQGMLELGYKRNPKRCKEKWENINKYFRKTKDINKKRSLDSRTCPYFYQLSTLYNQGTLVEPENRPALLENCPALLENHHGSSLGGNSSTDSTMHVAHGENNLVQVPAAFDFEL